MVHIEKSQQIANYVDFCNDCGNCDVFCPEHGGPYIKKPRFFTSRESWVRFDGRDGFFIEKTIDATILHGKIEDNIYSLRIDGKCNHAHFLDDAIVVQLELPSLKIIHLENFEPEKIGHVLDMSHCYCMLALLQGVIKTETVNYVNLAIGNSSQ
jgi:putative selenate reductase